MKGIAAALVISLPVCLLLGYSFGPPLLVPIAAAGALAVSFIGKPSEVLVARWTTRSVAQSIAFEIVLPFLGLTVLHGSLFLLGAMAGMAFDLSI